MTKEDNTKPRVYTEDELKAEASKELAPVVDMQLEMKNLELALNSNPEFLQFMQLRDAISARENEVKKELEAKMIQSGVKSVKVDEYGTFTIVDSKSWTYDEDELPKKFIKKVPDTTAINNHYKLTGKLPKGTSYVPKQFLKITPKKEKKA